MIILLFIPHEKSTMKIQIKNSFLTSFFTALLKFMGDTAEKMHRCRMVNSKFDLDIYKIYFVCAEIRIIICRLLGNENTGI